MINELEIPKPRTSRRASSVVRKCISIPQTLDVHSAVLVQKFKLSNFSEWVAWRMRKDLGIELPS